MLERYTAQYAIIYLKYFRSCRNYLSQCFKKDNIIPPSNIIPDHQKRIRNFYSLTFPKYSIKSGTKGFYKRYAIFCLETIIHISNSYSPDRSFKVKFNGIFYIPKKVSTGFPQVRILGSILCIIYPYDMPISDTTRTSTCF